MCAPDGRTTMKPLRGGSVAWTAVAGAFAGFAVCLAGWLAEMVMKSNTGILMNIIMGIVGAVVLNAILRALNI